jgi:predicted site-specific integrase-resolvase
MEVKTIKVEIRKHHVTPGMNILDLVIDANGEKIVKQTQHKDDDRAYKQFVEDIIKVAKELSHARLE